MTKAKKLSKREKLFCCFYAGIGSAREAAAKAGYGSNAQQAGQLLLMREEIQQQVQSCTEQYKRDLHHMALKGYRRLAFGSVADGIRLLYMEKPTAEELEEMDLFNIAEIKRKDNAVEIKFFDRHKAMEQLLLSQQNNQDRAVPFYQALQQGVAALQADPKGCEDGV